MSDIVQATDAACMVAPDVWVASMRPLAEQWERYRSVFQVLVVMAPEEVLLPVDYGQLKIVLPIPDDPNGLPQNVYDALYDLARGYAGGRVMTVCSMGENRSALMAGMILRARGTPMSSADMRARLIARSAKGPLHNPAFAAYLDGALV